jgi:hypothetical protein
VGRRVAAVARLRAAGDLRRRGDERIAGGAVDGDCRARLREARLLRLERLVRDVDSRLERVELRIPEDLPPGAARDLIGRLRRRPVGVLLERGRQRRDRRRWRCGRAAGAEEQRGNQGDLFQGCGFFGSAGATARSVPRP